MKRNLTFLLGLTLTAGLQFVAIQTSNGQGTVDDNFIFQVQTTAGSRDYYKGDCGWQYAQFGGNVPEEICNEIIWAYDITPDSLMCDTATVNLNGKWAIIRRGTCNFSLKAYYAQQAGATGVIIVNHYATTTDNACSVIGMSAGTNAALVTIPCIFVCREVGEFIDAGIKSGQPVNGCFVFPRVTDAAAAYHYATPLSQRDTFDHIGMRFFNRETSTLYNVGLTAVVEDPDGIKTTLTATIDSALADGTDVYTYFPAYLPPAKKGKFKITYSNDFYTESRDTLVRYFEQTDYTFATDNLVIDPGGISNDASFQAANLFAQSGALCLTGDNPGTSATFATFGLANAADIYIPNPFGEENDINVFLYDADADDDGTWEIANDGSGTWDDLAGGIVGYATYKVTGQEGVDELFSVALTDLNTSDPQVPMKPNHPYYISLAYDGTAAGTGIMPRFCNSLDEFYLNFPTTPLYLGQMYTGGWSGAIVIQRLELNGFVPGNSKTAVAKLDVDMKVTPNPAVDIVRVNLDFGKNTKAATVSLMTGLGKVVRSERLSNFESGQLTFNVNDLASGTYLLSVRTAEGVAFQKVAVCH